MKYNIYELKTHWRTQYLYASMNNGFELTFETSDNVHLNSGSPTPNSEF